MLFAGSKRKQEKTNASPSVDAKKNEIEPSALEIVDFDPLHANITYDAAGTAGLNTPTPERKQASVVEMLEYVKGLDIDPLKEADMLWIAEEAFNAPLPPAWSEHQDERGRLYFHNTATGKSEWRHPMDDVFKEVVNYQRQVVADGGFWNVENELASREEGIRRDLADWMELFDENTEKFFYNRRTNESRFDDPRMEKYHELYARIKLIAKMKERLPQLARNKRPKELTSAVFPTQTRANWEEEKYLTMIIRIQCLARVIIAKRKVKRLTAQAVVKKGPQPLRGKLRLRMEKVGSGRRHLVLTQTTPHRLDKAATKIQSRARGMLARKRMRPLVLHRQHLSKLVTKVQQRVRIWIAKRKVERMRLARKIRAAVTIQRIFRGFQDRKFLKGLTIEKTRFDHFEKKVVVIQSGCRMKLARTRVAKVRIERDHRMRMEEEARLKQVKIAQEEDVLADESSTMLPGDSSISLASGTLTSSMIGQTPAPAAEQVSAPEIKEAEIQETVPETEVGAPENQIAPVKVIAQEAQAVPVNGPEAEVAPALVPALEKTVAPVPASTQKTEVDPVQAVLEANVAPVPVNTQETETDPAQVAAFENIAHLLSLAPEPVSTQETEVAPVQAVPEANVAPVPVNVQETEVAPVPVNTQETETDPAQVAAFENIAHLLSLAPEPVSTQETEVALVQAVPEAKVASAPVNFQEVDVAPVQQEAALETKVAPASVNVPETEEAPVQVSPVPVNAPEMEVAPVQLTAAPETKVASLAVNAPESEVGALEAKIAPVTVNTPETEVASMQVAPLEAKVDPLPVNTQEVEVAPMQVALETKVDSVLVNGPEAEVAPVQMAAPEAQVDSVPMAIQQTEVAPMQVAPETKTDPVPVNTQETETDPVQVAAFENIAHLLSLAPEPVSAQETEVALVQAVPETKVAPVPVNFQEIEVAPVQWVAALETTVAPVPAKVPENAHAPVRVAAPETKVAPATKQKPKWHVPVNIPETGGTSVKAAESEDLTERELPPVRSPVRKSPNVAESHERKALFQEAFEGQALKLFREAPKKYKDKTPAGCPVAARRQEYDLFKQKKREASEMERLKLLRGRSESPKPPETTTTPAPPSQGPDPSEIKAAQIKLSQSDGALQGVKTLPSTVRKSYGGALVGGTFVKSSAETVHDMTDAEIQQCQDDIARLDAAKREKLKISKEHHKQRKKTEEQRKQDKFNGEMEDAEALEEERRKRKVKELKKWLRQKEADARAKKEKEQAMMQEVLQKEKDKADKFAEVEKKRTEERERRLRIGELQKAKLESQMAFGGPKPMFSQHSSKQHSRAMSGGEFPSSEPSQDSLAMQPVEQGKPLPQFKEQRVVHRHIHHHVHYHDGDDGQDQTPGMQCVSSEEQQQLEMKSEARVRSQLEKLGPLQLGRTLSQHSHQHIGMPRMEVDPGAVTPTNNRRAMSMGALVDGNEQTQKAFYPAKPYRQLSEEIHELGRRRGLEKFAGNVNRAFGSYADSGRPHVAQHLSSNLKPTHVAH